jgi:hypothetical protein
MRKETGQLLYIGVSNKYCASCAKNIPKKKHTCYQSWNESSSQMETDIILEGFVEAKKRNGVRYICFVGDGDSSVYLTLINQVPWGHSINQLECPITPVSVTDLP